MKLLRHGPKGHEKPALLDAGGTLRDLSGVIADITPQTLSPAGLAKLRALDVSSLPAVTMGRAGVPWTGLGKFIAIGLNYADHAAESNMPIPKEPIVFMKTPDCAVGANDPVVLPQGSVKSDWEVELGVVIGSTARYVSEADALKHVAGYCVINDVSEREYQLERGGQWDKGKGCETFGPIGPWLVTADEVPDPQALALRTRVNGRVTQQGSTAHMIHGVAALIAYLSAFMTLQPGDIILTGTPEGVVNVNPGDVVECEIDGIGTLLNTLAPAADTA